MLKPLLPSIPQKTLTIYGREYQVYECVTLYKEKARSGLSFFRMYVRFNGAAKYYLVRTYNNILNLKKRNEAIHQHLEILIDKICRIVENGYLGDKYRLSKLLPRYRVVDTIHHGHYYKGVSFRHYTHPGEKQKMAYVFIGRSAMVREHEIDAAIKRATDKQLEMNTKYNEEIFAMRKAFRTKVEKEIKERDALC